MAYAQNKYNELMGINGKYRISQIGCFLTSFSNLLERFGRPVSPLDLNARFRDAGIYVDIDDGVRDDLAWTSVTQFDSNVVLTRRGTGTPPSNNCIVKFTGIGTFGTHFCLVADLNQGLIIDSWDGQVKHWNAYGGPKEWAEYKDNTPASVPQQVNPVPTSPEYDGNSITVLPGQGLSHLAQTAGFGDFGNESRWSAIAALNGSGDWRSFNDSLKPGQRIVVGQPDRPREIPEFVTVQRGFGLANVAQVAGYPDWDTQGRWADIARLNGSGDWNAFNNGLITGQVLRVKPETVAPAPVPTPVVEAPQPAPAESPAEVVEVKVTPKPETTWKDTLELHEETYKASKTIIVKDLDMLHADKHLVKHQIVNAGATFKKDGITYLRTKKHITEGIWYGVPIDAVVKSETPGRVGPLDTTEISDDDLFRIDMSLEARQAFHNLTRRERIVEFVARVQAWILGFTQKDKKEGK